MCSKYEDVVVRGGEEILSQRITS